MSGPRHAAAIGVFAKAPIPGETKTRLVPAVGEEGAAALHRASLDRNLAAHHAATQQLVRETLRR